MTPQKKPIANELRELEVDRIDGVDRPATGRAFALYKSEVTPDMAMIHATLKKLFPSAADVIKNLIAKAIDENVLKCVDKNDKPTGLYIVRGTDVSSQPMSFEAACALVAKVIKGEIAEGRRKAGMPVDDEDEILTHAASGGLAALDDPNVNVTGQSLLSDDDEEQPSWWDRHKARGPLIDGVRQPSRKTANRKPRLL